MTGSRIRSYIYPFLLLTVTLFWGSTFILVKKAVEIVDVFSFLGVRFFLAASILSMALGGRWRKVDRQIFIRGFILGSFLFLAYAFQTLGLSITSASNAGFITGLSVVIVPIISAAVFHSYPPTRTIVGVIMAATGLFLMTGTGQKTYFIGDLLVLICAFFIASHILMTARFVMDSDPFLLAAAQLWMVAILSLLVLTFVPERRFSYEPVVIWALVITVLMATIFAFAVQMAAQRVVSPTNTALIFTMEPVFAAVFARLYGGEVLTTAGIIGGALIFCGMVLPEISPREWSGFQKEKPRKLFDIDNKR